ncbi:MAG: LemA family protein [Helicobacteraceae bacterium]|jgi:LemA protein|nr:LemA family protein [Helicobacteraceae bacterium]
MVADIVVAAIVALIVIVVIVSFNKLVALKNGYKNAFAQIEMQLKRRYDLIPNLVETVKGYLTHERETLQSVIEARNQAFGALSAAKKAANSAESIAALGDAEEALRGALSKLNVVVEAYPDLKANQNMLALQEELTSTENRISFARQAYNDSVTDFNAYRQSFPQNLFASLLGFDKDAGLLEFADSAVFQEPPKISFK